MARAYSVTSGPLFPIVNITLLVDLDDVPVKLSVVGVSAPAGHSTIVILYLDAYTYVSAFSTNSLHQRCRDKPTTYRPLLGTNQVIAYFYRRSSAAVVISFAVHYSLWQFNNVDMHYAVRTCRYYAGLLRVSDASWLVRSLFLLAKLTLIQA